VKITIDALRQLALRWCPRPARWENLLRAKGPDWGPAHEIAHALLSQPQARLLPNYGLCSQCFCPGECCSIAEVAAMALSTTLHRRAGRKDLVAAEAEATDNYDLLMGPWYIQQANRLLIQHKLQRLPRTAAGLEQLLSRRLA